MGIIERRQLKERLDAHALWLIERTVAQCRSPGCVTIVDTGQTARPRYRLLVADVSATADA